MTDLPLILKHQHFDLLGKAVFERLVFTPPLKLHTPMQDEACFIYNISGKAFVYDHKNKVNQSSGEALLMKCGHYVQNYTAATPIQENKEAEAVAIHLYPDVLRLIYNNNIPDFLVSDGNKPDVQIMAIVANEMIRKYIDSLIFYFENSSIMSEGLISLKIKELILLLLNTEKSSGVKSFLKNLFDPSIINLKTIIESHAYNNELTIEDLSTLSNMSLSSFKRKFKTIFNESPARFIKQKRLEKAAKLLKLNSLRINEICYDCGFNDPKHFSKSFKIRFGCSPSDYIRVDSD